MPVIFNEIYELLAEPTLISRGKTPAQIECYHAYNTIIVCAL